MNKILALMLIGVLAVIIAGCQAQQQPRVDVATEPLDAADALDVKPDPAADLGNETLSSVADETAEPEDIFEDPV